MRRQAVGEGSRDERSPRRKRIERRGARWLRETWQGGVKVLGRVGCVGPCSQVCAPRGHRGGIRYRREMRIPHLPSPPGLWLAVEWHVVGVDKWTPGLFSRSLLSDLIGHQRFRLLILLLRVLTTSCSPWAPETRPRSHRISGSYEEPSYKS